MTETPILLRPCSRGSQLALWQANHLRAFSGSSRSFHSATSVMFFLAVSLLASTMAAQTQPSRIFNPGSPKSAYASPDGRYAIGSIERDQEPRHSILLLDKTTGKTRKVYDYITTVVVSWAPDSSHFFMNDVSRVHDAYIFDIDEQTPTIDLQNEIQHQAKIDAAPADDQFDFARWLDSEHVVALSWRYAKDRPQRVSCHCYVYTLNGTIERCGSRSEAPDLEQLCRDLMRQP